MKQKTDLRIENAKSTTKEELVSKIKDSNQTLFDQMLIETEERKLYYYVKYKSTAFKRKAFQITFPIYTGVSPKIINTGISLVENLEVV